MFLTTSVKATSSPADDFPSPSPSKDASPPPSRVREIRCLEGSSTDDESESEVSTPAGLTTLVSKSKIICRFVLICGNGGDEYIDGAGLVFVGHVGELGIRES